MNWVPPEIDTGTTAWMLLSMGLVLWKTERFWDTFGGVHENQQW